MNRRLHFQKYATGYYTVLAYLISWVLWIPLYLPYFGIHILPVLPLHHALGALGPFAAAFIITFLAYGKNGTNELVSRLLKWDVPVKWHLNAWLSPFALLLGAAFIVYFTKGEFIHLTEVIASREFPQMTLDRKSTRLNSSHA